MSSGARVHENASSGGCCQVSSRSSPSIACPHMFRSMEYTRWSSPTLRSSSPARVANSFSSSRVISHSLAGAMIRNGVPWADSVFIPASNRTWSFPFPVHPWATATAPTSLAASTSFFAISGLPKAVDKAYTSSYIAPAFSPGTMKSLANSSFTSHTRDWTAPAEAARSRTPSSSGPPPMSTVRVTTSRSYCSRIQTMEIVESIPPLYASTHLSLGMGCVLRGCL